MSDHPPPLTSRFPHPPVAMSLRTRQSSSLALQRIFDQISSHAHASQPLDPLHPSSCLPVVEKREDDATRERPGPVIDSGVGKSADMELDNPRRAGAGVVPNPSAQAFKRFSNWEDDEVAELEVSLKVCPQTKRAHAKSPAAASFEKDLSFGCWNSLHNAGGRAQHTQRENLRKYPPDLDVTFQNMQTRNSSSSYPCAFGRSPTSTSSCPSPSDHCNFPDSTASRSRQNLPQAFQPRVPFRACMYNSSDTQPTAQLTVFYSGMVNVYDDVPADKAHAIMLLAGVGDSRSSNLECTPRWDRERTPIVGSPTAVALPLAAPLSAAFPARGSFGCPAPSMPATSAIVPAVASPAITLDDKPPSAVKRLHAGIELPHARKASLARFLEKRKDRVQVQQNEGSVTNECEKNAEARSDKPGSLAKKQRNARSRSPASPS